MSDAIRRIPKLWTAWQKWEILRREYELWHDYGTKLKAEYAEAELEKVLDEYIRAAVAKPQEGSGE